MKIRIFSHLIVLLCIAVIPCSVALAQSMSVDGKNYSMDDGDWFLKEGTHSFRVKTDLLTVRFHSQLTGETLSRVIRELGMEEIRRNRFGYLDLRIKTGELSITKAEALLSDARVIEAYPACYGEFISNDPAYSSQWQYHNTGSGGGTPDADIDAPEAWAIATGDPSIIVAPLDSGIDYHHNDLGPNLWQNLAEDADNDGRTLLYSGGQWVLDSGDLNGIDDDGNGKTDDLIGWDVEYDDYDLSDPMGHGTHVSGTVAARTNNSNSVAGVAGGWGDQAGVSIMMVQVGEYAPSGDALDDAILYAVDNGARVITMSLSVPETSAINAALDYAVAQGVFVDCAAGNNYGGSCSYPSTRDEVMAVSATTRNDTFAYFSAAGVHVEISAPGDDVVSTTPGQSSGSNSGTSMAAPHVAGAAGLVLSVAPWMNGEQVRYVLAATSDDLGATGWDSSFGEGRLNLYNAVRFAADLTLLRSDAFTINPMSGGSIGFTLTAGPAFAGRPYILLASITGTSPGTPVGSTTLPLNWDGVTDLCLSLANSVILPDSLGYLDGAGTATAAFNAGPNDLRTVAGETLHFAYMLGNPLDQASNPVPLLIDN